MSRQAVLLYLVNDVIVPDIQKSAFPFVAEETTYYELENHYAVQFGPALGLQIDDWEFILSSLERWYDRERLTDPAWQEYMKREEVWDEMVSRCESLPSYDQVVDKLGVNVAETYMANVETIENTPNAPEIGVEGDFTRQGKKATFTKGDMEDIVYLVSILTFGDRDTSVEDYERRKRSKRATIREKRERTREANYPYIDRAQSLGIWFPYPDQMPLWKADARTARFYPYLVEMLKQVRKKMKGEHCILQYIPKRRLTSKTAGELPRILENMGRYLMG